VVRVARSYWTRLCGLMLRRGLAETRLWFPRCASVHTWLMLEQIDIVFLDAERRVVRLYAAARPWRVWMGGPGADSVLELGAGAARRHDIAEGDRMLWPD
jgi:uncharacterized protein